MARQADAPRALDELRLEIAELRASRKRLALAADAERRGIERALHDGLQQQLVGLAADLELATATVDDDPATTKRLLADSARDVREALEETRRLAQRIYPPLLEAGGLRAALRAAAVDAGVRLRVDVLTGMSLPPDVAGTVYFCFLDLLERSPAGTPVAVTVRDDAGVLAFEIVVGGDVDADRPSLRDRVEAVGGRLTIGFQRGGETRVAGSLPLADR